MSEGVTIEKRLRELAIRAAKGSRCGFSRFLEPPEQLTAEIVARQAGARLLLWGGYEGAERKIAAFIGEDEEISGQDFPIGNILLRWDVRYGDVGHRDLMGAVMALGLERDTLGDIVFCEEAGSAVLFASDTMADCVCANLDSAGHARLHCSCVPEWPPLKKPEGEYLRLVVSAFRMDCVLAAAYKLSRSQAQKLIASGLVKRNHIPELHADIRLDEGDLLSVRGKGRMRLEKFEGESKKGRLVVSVFRYA